MISRILDNTISGKMAKEIFDCMWEGDGDADDIIKSRGLKQVSDTNVIESLVNNVLQNNHEQLDNYLQAEKPKRQKMLGYFVGQIMKASKGQANPKQVNSILVEKLDSMTDHIN